MALGKKTGGRHAGVPNKITSGVKSNIIGVFDKIGGRDKMAAWALENQTEFYKLYGRLAPNEIVGPDGGAIHHRVEQVIVDPKD